MKKLVALLLLAAPGCETARVVSVEAEVTVLLPAPTHAHVALRIEK